MTPFGQRHTFTRDPETGYLIGPKGGHYERETLAFHYEALHLCGCSRPVSSYNFMRRILMACDRRGEGWIDAQRVAEELVVSQPHIAAEILLHILSHLELLEHGGNIGGSWLTPLGEQLVDAGERFEGDDDDE